jgi:predicted ribosomally synthesized peptide with SipW-like signal peptide
MSDKEFSLSRRKALAGLGSIGAATALGGIGTLAQFTDTEESSVTFTAGGIDGEIEWSGSYNGNHVGGQLENVEVDDDTVMGDVHFSDVKPGDYGCVNFGITVENNPAWVASCLDVRENVDHKIYEPEARADDDIGLGSVGQVSTDPNSGELAQNMMTIPYYDSDGTCRFFDSGGPKLDAPSYDCAVPSVYWSNAEDGSESGDDYLAPRSVWDVSQNVRAKNTKVWNSDEQTVKTISAPNGTSVGTGCVFLDGQQAGGPSDDNTRPASPLSPGRRRPSDSSSAPTSWRRASASSSARAVRRASAP